MSQPRTIHTDTRQLAARAVDVLDRLSREPVLIGAALIGAYEVRYPGASPGAHALMLTVITLFQRAFSTSKRTAEENSEIGKYVGALENGHTPSSGSPVP